MALPVSRQHTSRAIVAKLNIVVSVVDSVDLTVLDNALRIYSQR